MRLNLVLFFCLLYTLDSLGGSVVKQERVSAFTKSRIPLNYSSVARVYAFNPTSVCMKTQ